MRTSFSTNLQVTRAAAALAVVLVHAGPQLDAAAGAERSPSVPWLPFDLDIGVDVFFVVSGFVMLQVTWDTFGQHAAVRSFIARRAVRIVPLYWTCTTFALLVAAVLPHLADDRPPSALYVVASYLFVPWPDATGAFFPVLVPGWTLAFEMFFYAAVASVLVLPRRIALPVLTAGLVCLVAVSSLPGAPTWLHEGWGNPLVLEFLAGVGLGCLWRRGLRFGHVTMTLVVVAGLGLAAISWTVTTAFPSGAVDRALALGVPAVVLVAAVALGPQLRPRGAGRLLIAIGDGSYAIYLTHTIALKAVAVAFAAVAVPRPLGVCIAILACVVVGLAVDRYLDRPVRRVLTGLLHREPDRTARHHPTTRGPLRPLRVDSGVEDLPSATLGRSERRGVVLSEPVARRVPDRSGGRSAHLDVGQRALQDLGRPAPSDSGHAGCATAGAPQGTRTSIAAHRSREAAHCRDPGR